MAVSVIENPPISFVLPNLNKTSPPIVPFKPKLVAVVWNNSILLLLSSCIVIFGVDGSASSTIPLVEELKLSNLLPSISQFAILPDVAVTLPVKKTFSLNNPKPGDEPTNALDNPDKSPSLAFKSTSNTLLPVLSTISMYGVVVSLGFAFSLMYPVPILPVETTT